MEGLIATVILGILVVIGGYLAIRFARQGSEERREDAEKERDEADRIARGLARRTPVNPVEQAARLRALRRDLDREQRERLRDS